MVNLLGRLCWLLAVCLLCVCACNGRSVFHEEGEGLGLSNDEYMRDHVSGGGFPGASSVDTAYRNDGFATGRTERWTRVAIDAESYEAWWLESDDVEVGEKNPQPGAPYVALFDRVRGGPDALPVSWPATTLGTPQWWRAPTRGEGVEFSAWEGTNAEGEHDSSYWVGGESWAYDYAAEELWVWWWRERF